MNDTHSLFDLPPGPFRRTKMVCTLGPSSITPSMLRQLIQEGMDVARFNFSHGTHDQYRVYAKELKHQAQMLGKPIALLQDLQGPKIRIGEMSPGVVLQKGTYFVITILERVGSSEGASTTYKNLPAEVKEGDIFLLDDGALKLQVESISSHEIVTKVLIGGPLGSHKGINFPSPGILAPILSDKDLADLTLGKELGMNFVALSFVRSAKDVLVAKARIQELNQWSPLLIAKIEQKQAVANLKEILEVADGLMVARGDLGVEVGLTKVPLIQKEAIEQANQQGKLIITATQMLESMIEHSAPTRAEVSDVTNAVLDGSDAVMLSAETASGHDPALVVRMMSAILQEVEQTPRFFQQIRSHASSSWEGAPQALAKAAVAASGSLASAFLLAWDEEGELVKLLSEARPRAFVVAVSSQKSLCQAWALYWGVIPVFAHARFESFASWKEIIPRLSKNLWAEQTQKYVVCLRASSKTEPKCSLEIHTLF